MYPRRGSFYSLEQILNDLELEDSPYLQICVGDHESVIQTSHLTDKELLSVPGLGATLWQYQYTTSEWIPLFVYASDNNPPIETFVDVEKEIEWDGSESPEGLWVTPKGFPREQYRTES